MNLKRKICSFIFGSKILKRLLITSEKNTAWCQTLRSMMRIQSGPSGLHRPPTTCRVNSNVLFKPCQDLRDLVLASFTTSAPTKLPPNSAISLVPSLPLCCYLASEQVVLSTPGMFQARSLCLGVLICWNVPFLHIHVTQSLYCPKSLLRVNFHDCHCCYKNRKH